MTDDLREEAVYNYRDQTGRLLYQHIRFERKQFCPCHRDGAGNWRWGLGTVARVLYRLPELLAADRDAWTFITEGEKDCDAVRAIGRTATTPGPPWWWKASFREHFRGRRVCILPDNDVIGRAFARRVVMDIRGAPAVVRILELPGLPPHGDVSDWLGALTGQTPREQAAALVNLADAAPDWLFKDRDYVADSFWPSLIPGYVAASSGAERAGNINSILCWT